MMVETVEATSCEEIESRFRAARHLLAVGTLESNSARGVSYMPQDLRGHYDSEAALHVRAKCGGEQAMLTNHYPRETRRRRKCTAVPSTFVMAQRSAVPSVMESLVSSATTPGELPSVQGSALIASRPAGRLTAHGYAGS
jgi:hypothetical protein